MTCTAQKDEGTLCHFGVFHGQEFWIASSIISEYRVNDTSMVRGGLLAHNVQPSI
jgi:hypothetical protein